MRRMSLVERCLKVFFQNGVDERNGQRHFWPFSWSQFPPRRRGVHLPGTPTIPRFSYPSRSRTDRQSPREVGLAIPSMMSIIGLAPRLGTAVLPICSMPGNTRDGSASRRRAASALNQSGQDGSADTTSIGSSTVAEFAIPRRLSKTTNAACVEASIPDRRSGSLSAGTAIVGFISY